MQPPLVALATDLLWVYRSIRTWEHHLTGEHIVQNVWHPEMIKDGKVTLWEKLEDTDHENHAVYHQPQNFDTPYICMNV